MAKQKNIKQDNKQGFDIKVKRKYFFILALGILLFYISTVLDERAYSAFSNAGVPIANFIFGIITNFGVVLILFLALPSFILYKKNRGAVYLLILAFVFAFLASFIIKMIVLRQRPIETFVFPLINIINYSFPSMHSMVVFALLPILAHHLPQQKHFWIILAVLVAFTRVYFSFHYLSDVVFGIVFGYFIGLVLLHLHKDGRLWSLTKAR